MDQAKPLDNCDGKIMMMRNGRWQKMFRPVNPDRHFSGTCFAERFAKEYVTAHPEHEVCIIPCADGGTKLEQWFPGELLFENAVNCAKLAMRTSRLMGILWHQGESDCSPALYPLYAERFKRIMDTLRKELNVPDLPVLVGGLGDYLANYTKSEVCMTNYVFVNEQLEKVAAEYPNCRFVSARGLGANPDNLHFNAEALDEFGARYFTEYTKLDPPKYDEDKVLQDDSARTNLEEL